MLWHSTRWRHWNLGLHIELNQVTFSSSLSELDSSDELSWRFTDIRVVAGFFKGDLEGELGPFKLEADFYNES